MFTTCTLIIISRNYVCVAVFLQKIFVEKLRTLVLVALVTVLVQAPNALFEHIGGKMRRRDLVFSNFRFTRLERALHMRVIRSDIAPFRKRLNGPVKNIPKVPLVSCIGLLVVVLAII